MHIYFPLISEGCHEVSFESSQWMLRYSLDNRETDEWKDGLKEQTYGRRGDYVLTRFLFGENTNTTGIKATSICIIEADYITLVE